MPARGVIIPNIDSVQWRPEFVACSISVVNKITREMPRTIVVNAIFAPDVINIRVLIHNYLKMGSESTIYDKSNWETISASEPSFSSPGRRFG